MGNSGRRAMRLRAEAAVSSRGGLLAGVVLVAIAVTVAVLVSSDGTRVINAPGAGGGRGELRVVGERGQLIVQGLRPPPGGEVYEVWVEPPHSPPLPTRVLFTVAAHGEVDLRLPGSLNSISRVLVTAEPPGGSLSPTGAPVLTFRVR